MSFLSFPARSGTALVAVGDPSRDRTVYATIVLLVALGFTMIMLAVWLLRSTRPDPEVLAPLERMGQRRWRRADPVWQRRHLDEVRPGGADPLEPMTAPPATDADFERGPQPIGFDDLVVADPAPLAGVSDLPAPAAGAVPVDGPDAATVAGADVDAASAPHHEAGDDAATPAPGTTDDVSPDADAGDQDDEDEDITGEQDNEDFLAVLDQVDELDLDVDPGGEVEAIADAETESISNDNIDPDVDPVSEPDVERVVVPVGEADVESDGEPDVDAERQPDGKEHDEAG